MEFDEINVFAVRGTDLVRANVYVNGDYIGETGIGGCWGPSGLTGIKVPVEEINVEVSILADKIELKGFLPDGNLWTSQTILFNFDTMNAIVLSIRR